MLITALETVARLSASAPALKIEPGPCCLSLDKELRMNTIVEVVAELLAMIIPDPIGDDWM